MRGIAGAPLLFQQQLKVLVGEGDGGVGPGAIEAAAVAVAAPQRMRTAQRHNLLIAARNGNNQVSDILTVLLPRGETLHAPDVRHNLLCMQENCLCVECTYRTVLTIAHILLRQACLLNIKNSLIAGMRMKA